MTFDVFFCLFLWRSVHNNLFQAIVNKRSVLNNSPDQIKAEPTVQCFQMLAPAASWKCLPGERYLQVRMCGGFDGMAKSQPGCLT